MFQPWDIDKDFSSTVVKQLFRLRKSWLYIGGRPQLGGVSISESPIQQLVPAEPETAGQIEEEESNAPESK